MEKNLTTLQTVISFSNMAFSFVSLALTLPHKMARLSDHSASSMTSFAHSSFNHLCPPCFGPKLLEPQPISSIFDHLALTQTPHLSTPFFSLTQTTPSFAFLVVFVFPMSMQLPQTNSLHVPFPVSS
jgi:hypothetical protein